MVSRELKEKFEKRTLEEKKERKKDEAGNYLTKTKLEEFNETGKVKVYPSELSFYYYYNNQKIVEGSCLRAMYYKFFETPETDPASIEIEETFELGLKIEEIIKKELFSIGELEDLELSTEVETKIEIGDLIISGRMDAVLKDGTIIEIKSHKHHDFTAKKLAGGEMLEYHFSQAAIYLAYKLKEEPDKEPTLIMIYKNRNTLETNFIDVKMDFEGCLYVSGKKVEKYSLGSCIERAREFAMYVKTKQLPPKDYGYYKNLPKEKIDALSALGKINRSELLDLSTKGFSSQVKFFNCTSCAYKSICLNLD